MNKLVMVLIIVSSFILINGCADMNCISDDDCPKNYRCYNSQPCVKGETGLECGPQEGDLKCHKLCSTRLECNYLGDCKEFTIFKEDTSEKIEMCD